MADFSGPPLASERGIGALTLGGFLAEVCAAHGPREALVFRSGTHPPLRSTYADLLERSRTLSRALVAADAGAGTRVALVMGNRPEWVAACFGVVSIGAVLVPVNTFFTPDELEYVLAHSRSELVLTQAELASHRFAQDISTLRARLPHLRSVHSVGTRSWDQLLEAAGSVEPAEVDARAASVQPDDDALVVYTSGTTARPKAVLHSNRAPALQSWRFAQQLGLDPSARTWSAYPYFWTAGFCMVMGATLAAGGCLVQQELFDPGEAIALLEAERVTTPFAWPHQVAALADHPSWEAADLSSLRHVEPRSAYARHDSVTVAGDGYSPRSAYGTTETFTIVSSLPSCAPAELRAGNHGAVLPGNTVRIVDPETGAPLGAGEYGEIRVKGPTLMKGYLGAPRSACFDEDGFYPTGDAGCVDTDGMLHWTGRMSLLIKTGGANVSPVEVEETLLGHPDLAASVVVGVPHETLGEMVVLLTAPRAGHPVTEEEVRRWMRERLASYKVPKRVVLVRENELKQTGNAKLEPEAARALALIRLGAPPA